MIPRQPDHAAPLPALRPELEFLPGAPNAAGQSMFLIHDPLRHRFVQVDALTRDLIGLFPTVQSRAQLAQAAETELTTTLDDKEVDRLISFLQAHELTQEPNRGGWRFYAHRDQTQSKASLSKLAHRYLFFRIPLWRPQRFLELTYPVFGLLLTRVFAILTLLVGTAGIYLASRQWDNFFSTFSHLFNWEGLALFAISIIAVKGLHELAHAYVAVRYGCKVPTIGVAFMLLTPMPYTDVTDAWRLRDRRRRLAVDAAGISAELVIAAYATFFWAFLPEGPAKSVAFMLATVGWLMSLAINLNPFMRFDGYYILSEFTGIENLQPRAFAVLRWRLREILFALNAPCPEQLSRASVNWLFVYGVAIAVYRLFLYVGIALIVYHITFKVLGVILFLIEIVFLVLRPVWNEIQEWIAMRGKIAQGSRWLISAMVLAALVAVMVVPWSGSVTVPALLGHSGRIPLHAKQPAQIAALDLEPGAVVGKGKILVRLVAPAIDNKLRQVERKIELVRLRLGRRTADRTDLDATIVLERELAALQTQRGGLLKERADLEVRAPVNATVLEVADNLHVGRWVDTETRLALLGEGNRIEAVGYLRESDVARVEIGTTGVLIPDEPTAPRLRIRLVSISATGAETISHPELTSEFGGPIAVERGDNDRLIPRSGAYLVKFAVEGAPPRTGMVRGIIHLDGKPESLAARFWRQTLKVLAREAGA